MAAYRWLVPVLAAALPLAAQAQTAATVNGQAIPESAVERGLKRVPAEQRDKARPDILNFLIANALVDQYLTFQQKIEVPAADVEKRMSEIDAELKKINKDRAALYKDLAITEAEFKEQVVADLRWEKYAESKVNDAALQMTFEKHKDTFDGTLVRARHILLSPATDANKAELAKIKQQIEANVARDVEKLPADVREAERGKFVEEAFAAAAKEKSVCPSNRDGGDVNWFPRMGSMVESFAKAAFGLKLFEISDPVETHLGYHLILATARKPGQPVKFEEVREAVKDMYCLRLREALVAELKPKANIVIGPK